MSKYRCFFLKLLLYSLPFALGFGLVVGIALYMGEVIPFAEVARQQQQHTVLYRPRMTRIDVFFYKLVSIQIRQPTVVIMGSSRVQNVRSQIFNQQPDQFFNATVAGSSIDEQVQLFKVLADNNQLPPIIFWGFDLPDFNADYDEFRLDRLKIYEPTLIDYGRRLWEGVEITAETLASKPKRSLVEILQAWSNQELSLGWVALETQRGYISDGSFYLTGISPERVDNIIEVHRNYLAQGQRMYETGSELNSVNINHIAEMLTLAQAHGITVIGYIPSYRSDFYADMISSGEYDYIPLVRAALQTTFADYNMPFFDFTEIEAVQGASNSELFDSWHSSELFDMRMYSVMLHEESDLLANYSDVVILDEQIVAATNPYYVFTTIGEN